MPAPSSFPNSLSVIILAGGYGTRLYPMTINVAKPLLPVGERTILDYTFEKLANLSDINEIVITANRRFEHQFIKWLDTGAYRNVRIMSEESHSEADKLGAIRALSKIIGKVHAEDYLVIGGDNLFTSELDEFVKHYRKKTSPIIALYDVKDPAVAKNFAVVSVDSEGKIIDFEEKPDRPGSTLISACIYLLPARTLRRVREYLADRGNPDSPGHFIKWLSKKESVYGHMLVGNWWDVGTPESYGEVREFFSLQLVKPIS